MRNGNRPRTVNVALAICVAITLAMGISHASPSGNRPPDNDPVLLWNDQANLAIQLTNTDPFKASRALAIESIAVFDTIRSMNAVPGFLVRLPVPGEMKASIAIASAAHIALLRLFPERRAALDGTYARAIAQEPESAIRARSVRFGQAVAEAVLAVRDRDGWNAKGSGLVAVGPGYWRPTPPRFESTLDPQWATLVPFALTGPAQFRPAAPPAPDSKAYHDAIALLTSIGVVSSSVRTAAQTEIARYWSDAIGTYAPAGHWNAIAAQLVAASGTDLEQEAALFTKLNVAMADAGVAVADAKYTYWSQRPITVIRSGGASQAPIPDWEPLLRTPNHPGYISGHSGFSGAAAVVLTDQFGARPFRFTSANLPGVTREFADFQQAAEEAAASRVFGGIHFPFDNAEGLVTGRAVGNWALAAFRRIAEDRGSVIVLDHQLENSAEGQRLAGFAVDNASPLTEIRMASDGGEPVRVPVDGQGRFTIPPRTAGSGDVSQLVLTAISVTGRVTTVRKQLDDPNEQSVTISVPVTVK